MVLDKIRIWVSQVNDFYSLLLIGCIVTENKTVLANRRFIALDYYLKQIELCLQPKLHEAFGLILKDMNIVNVRTLKQIMDSVKEDEFMARTVNFLEGCGVIGKNLKLDDFSTQNETLKFIEVLLAFLLKVSKESVIEKDELTINTNCHYILVKVLKNSDGFVQENLYRIETRLNDTINRLVDKFLEEYFEKIVKFLNGNKTGDSNLKSVEETSRDFCENWKLKLANLKNEIEFRFQKPEISSKIMKMLVHKMLELYQEFCNFVKSVYPSYTSNLYPIHKLNVEIKSIVNN